MTEAHKKERQQLFLQHVQTAVDDDAIVKLSLGNYQGSDESLKKILIKPIIIKKRAHWNIVYRHNTKDITKNIDTDKAVQFIDEKIDEGFRTINVFAKDKTILYENIHDKKIIVKVTPTISGASISRTHDKVKQRIISPDRPYLKALRISNQQGEIYKATQDKYRQLNHFITLMEPVLPTIESQEVIRIADMGSGKGYLTFALYDYLSQKMKAKVDMTGIELRPDLVDQCNDVARSCQYDGLSFQRQSIQAYMPAELDGLIALHACDTATDDAIAVGIRASAKFIIVAPCCHKQIRQELEKSKRDQTLSSIIRHGVFLERHAEILTDAIRILVMEYFGYKVKAMEFISDSHTPKNVMLRATKTKHTDQAQKLAEIKSLMDTYHITSHYLVDSLI